MQTTCSVSTGCTILRTLLRDTFNHYVYTFQFIHTYERVYIYQSRLCPAFCVCTRRHLFYSLTKRTGVVSGISCHCAVPSHSTSMIRPRYETA